MPQNYTTILDEIVRTHHLPSTKNCHQQPHPAYGFLYTAVVSVNHRSYQATFGDLAQAKEQAAKNAVDALEAQGFKRPRRHYRTEINNIGNKYKFLVEYDDKCRGPPHKCVWTSTVYVGGVRAGWADNREKGVAREDASKMAVEYFETRGYYI